MQQKNYHFEGVPLHLCFFMRYLNITTLHSMFVMTKWHIFHEKFSLPSNLLSIWFITNIRCVPRNLSLMLDKLMHKPLGGLHRNITFVLIRNKAKIELIPARNFSWGKGLRCHWLEHGLMNVVMYYKSETSTIEHSIILKKPMLSSF